MQNPQYLIFNEDRALLEGPRTIICTGLGRTGTSAVTSLLSFLGVWVGPNKKQRNLENKKLIKALKKGPEEAQQLIAQYNERFPVWGFKAPSLRRSLNETLSFFRNPMVIVPHRDAVGKLSRHMVSKDKPITLEGVRRTMVGQRRLVDELIAVPAPQLHIAFPLLASEPEQALEVIANFVGLPIPKGDVRTFAEEARNHYLSPKEEVASEEEQVA